MGVRQFFRSLFPTLDSEGLITESFALLYNVPGMSWEAFLDMDRMERGLMLQRLLKQKKAEEASLKKSSKVKRR